MSSFLEDEDVLYVDLPGKRTSENPSSTVPVSILATSPRPDMVLIRNMVITLIELTVPYDSRENLRNGRARKSQKRSYLELLGDLEAKGYSASLATSDISSFGPCLICLKATHEIIPTHSSVHAMFDAGESIAISTSFSIFLARRNLVAV